MNCSCCEEPVTFVHAKDKTGQIAIRPGTKNNRPPCQIRRGLLSGPQRYLGLSVALHRA